MRISRLTHCLGIVFAVAIVGPALAQTDLHAESAFVADSSGRPALARLGEPFYIGLRFTVSGSVTSSYRYRVETPYGSFETPLLSLGVRQPGSYWACWGPIPSLMDAPVSVRAVLDPDRRVRESNRTNNSVTLTVEAIPPALSCEPYDRKAVSGKLGLDVVWQRTSAVPTEVTFWHPLVSTLAYQAPANIASDLHQIVSERFEQPIGVRTLHPLNRESIRSEAPVLAYASSFRINRRRLEELGRRPSWGQETWLRPESLVESNRAEVRAWSGSVLSRLGNSASTVTRAEALYRSVLERCTYEYRSGLSASALQMARRRRGDCGGFSSLFVALCRSAGIPARTVGGFGVGENQWHVWAEFHVEGAGWIPADPSFAELRQPAGSGIPLYFGVVPELNRRIATMVGFDREAAGRFVPMLQSPAVFWSGNGVRLERAEPFALLSQP